MSTRNLYQFLTRLDEELETKSRVYRETVSDKKIHVFTLRSGALVQETIKELQLRGLKLSPEFAQRLKYPAQKAVDEVLGAIMGVIQHGAGKKSNIALAGPRPMVTYPDGFRVTLSAAWRSTAEETSTFAAIKTSYKENILIYIKEVQRLIRRTRSTTKEQRQEISAIKNVGDFFHLGHDEREGASVVDQQIKSIILNIAEELEDPSLNKRAAAEIGDLGYIISAVMNTELGIMYVTLESGKDNSSRGGRAGRLKDELRKSVQAALARLQGGFAEMDGSDSPKTVKRKKAIKAVTDPFRKIKGAKVTTETTKINKSKGGAKLKKKAKITPGTAKPFMPRSPITGRFISREEAGSVVNLKTLINAKLPQTVAKNMGEPRLVYRTGVFAGSARVLNVGRNAQNDLVVDYTYQNEPYGVFEMGKGIPPWATPDRDPRKIIDLSIREIAAQIVTEKLHTRRIES